jgi:hypothetical protein
LTLRLPGGLTASALVVDDGGERTIRSGHDEKVRVRLEIVSDERRCTPTQIMRSQDRKKKEETGGGEMLMLVVVVVVVLILPLLPSSLP